MADQLALSLRAWPSEDTSTESLSYLIARINEQRGSFRSVTEASLEEEIRAANVGEEDHLPDDNDASQESHDANAKGEELAIAREDMIKRVSEAYNTCSQALDLVSLLLTSHTPKVAEATVSPYVKQTVSFGSLGAEIMHHTNGAGSQETSEDLVGLGWRMRSLTRSADSILTSATRLEQEMGRESTYWQQILEIKEAGWPVSRLPGDRQTLGVRFGFAEAHAEFRDRGLVALRRDADGNVELDHGQRWRGEKRIRVRVVKDGRVLAEPPTNSMGDDKTLSQRLLRARNSLFDEELYHELSREGRNLVSQAVRCVGPNICVPYDADSQIEISLVDVAMEEPLDVSCEDSSIPSAIAITLRLLLSHAHRQNLQRRLQPPPPITDTPIARPVYSLLRPILEIIQHQSARKTVEAEFTALNFALSSAGLPFTTEETSSSLHLNRATDDFPTDPSTARTLINRLIRPHHSQITLSLPKHTTLMLDVNTSVFPPTFGTSFQLTTTSSAPGSAIADMPHVMPFPTIEALRKHIWYVTSLDIVAALQAMPPASGWTQPSPYQAELQRKTVALGQKDRLSVSLDSEGLALSWVCSGKTGSRVWRTDSRAEEGVLSLVEVMKEQFG
ncbi:MAG: hypothetical protein LQ339_004795 [Xanthoria mediterranea]|nr:MAG: hypothetical protein LQ339_004795 [Xanthoria mediterranea]